MNENLMMVRGDTFSFSIEIEGLLEDLIGASFSCRKNENESEYIFQKTLGSGIEKTEETANSKTYKVTVAPSDTAALEKENYFYDLELTSSENEVFTPYLGILKVVMDCTHN